MPSTAAAPPPPMRALRRCRLADAATQPEGVRVTTLMLPRDLYERSRIAGIRLNWKGGAGAHGPRRVARSPRAKRPAPDGAPAYDPGSAHGGRGRARRAPARRVQPDGPVRAVAPGGHRAATLAGGPTTFTLYNAQRRSRRDDRAPGRRPDDLHPLQHQAGARLGTVVPQAGLLGAEITPTDGHARRACPPLPSRP